jgi:hypothetical protein
VDEGFMKRIVISAIIMLVALLALALFVDGGALAPFVYRNF